MHLTEDESQMIIIDQSKDDLICRVSFHDSMGLDINDKKNIGQNIISTIFTAIENKKVTEKKDRATYFLEAFEIEKNNNTHLNRENMVMILTNILELSNDEANKKFDMFVGIIKHPDFKDKVDIIAKKIFLSQFETFFNN